MGLSTIFLYIILHDDNSSGERFRTRMPDMETCMKAVTNAKMPVPSRTGGDYEVMGAMWCGGEFHRQYGGSWHNDELKGR